MIQFQENLKRAKELGSLASAVEAVTTSVIDVSDMWRSQIVLVVSALDHFVHDITRLGMIEIAKGSRQKTDAYLRFQMPFTAVESALNGVPHENWVGETVREKLSWQSFQDPDKLAEAVRLISVVKLWEAVGIELNMPAADVKTRLKLIVERRNKIAHEADLDPANPGFRWPINAGMATDTINFIENVGKAVFKVAI
ncbi:MAG: HEPN domain-containing protein [Gallionellaceae bacterium]